MGYFDNEMGEMLDVYLLETGQLLDQADAILMRAEKSGHLEAEDINGIFRIMHTTKSSSAMMGLDALSGLAHRLEDVFSEFREDPDKLSGIERDAFNLIFDVTGFLRSELERMTDAGYVPAKTEQLAVKIDALVSRLKKNRTVAVKLRFEKNCRMEHVRAFMVTRQIQNLCSNLRTYPEDVGTNPATDDDIRENGFYLSFTTADPEPVLKRLSRALFVESCQLVDEMPDQHSVQAEQTKKERAEESAERGKAPEQTEDRSGPAPFRAEGNFINVKLERLDQLQSVTEELLIASSALKSREGADVRRSGPDSSEDRQLARCLKELKSLVASIRMIPFAGFVPKLNRVVRDMCRKERKEVIFSVTGQEVEVDKAIADSIMEPLLHLIRNAVDHGIEPTQMREQLGKTRAGHVNLKFANLGGEISVEIEDDGAGMNLERIGRKAEERGLLTKPAGDYSRQELLELCLLPGFSTRDSASEFSGRGVGMDVVSQTVERLGGHIRLESEEGKGSRIRLTFPLTLTIIEGIRFQAGDYSFAVPSYQVKRFFSCDAEAKNIVSQDGGYFWVHEGRYIPVVFLARFYAIEQVSGKADAIMAYVRGAEREACLVLDAVMEQGNIVVKALPGLFGKRFRRETGISGCSIMGDGSACMLLDVESLIRIFAKGGIDRRRNEKKDGEESRERRDGRRRDGEREVLCVKAQDAYYGIELSDIQELLEEANISRMPCLPGWFEGICSYRGAILPVLSFGRLAGIDGEGGEDARYRVVAAVKGGKLECGFMTGREPVLLRVSAEERLEGELPYVLGAGLRVEEMYSLEGEILYLINVEETLERLIVRR